MTLQPHLGDIPLGKGSRTSSQLKQNHLTLKKLLSQRIEPQPLELRQWIVVEGQCVPIKQELAENASGILVKQEHFVDKRQSSPIFDKLEENSSSIFVRKESLVNEISSLPIMEELEENTSSILVKQENLVEGQCLPIKKELEENITTDKTGKP